MAKQIKASITLQKELKKCHLTARQKAFADLISMGWIDKDAYQLVGLYDEYLVPPENWKEMRKVEQTAAFANYIPKLPESEKKKKKEAPPQDTPAPQEQTQERAEHSISDDEMETLLSKDNQLKELLWKLKNENLDIQSEIQIRKMIADIQQFKKEKTQVEEKRTLFYLPLQCYQCSLYKEKKNKKGVK